MDDALVGRGPELVVLGDFLTRSAADGGALLLTGEPGVGKTALLQAAAGSSQPQPGTCAPESFLMSSPASAPGRGLGPVSSLDRGPVSPAGS